MTKDEALKLALEALESCGEDEWYSDDDFGMSQIYDEDMVNKAITAIKEALAQPQRTWVGLTDEEVRQMCGSVPSMREAVRETEAKLKGKNT